MERQDFINQFNEVKKDGNYGYRENREVHNLIRQHMLILNQPDVPVGFQELFISIEELAELIQATTKALRGKKDEVNLIEELADVHLVLKYIETVLDIDHDDVEVGLEVKIRKLEGLLNDAKSKGIGLHDMPERGMR
ncbi:MAG: hypothetical protein NC548_60455 [Lachnospiraceae bacterium]|nr:hypothetical protein [Lachnospiraceae bacterium]